MMRRRALSLGVAGAVAIGLPVSLVAAQLPVNAAPQGAKAKSARVTSADLTDAVTVGGVLKHERVFQRIANRNGGNRASATPATTPPRSTSPTASTRPATG